MLSASPGVLAALMAMRGSTSAMGLAVGATGPTGGSRGPARATRPAVAIAIPTPAVQAVQRMGMTLWGGGFGKGERSVREVREGVGGGEGACAGVAVEAAAGGAGLVDDGTDVVGAEDLPVERAVARAG